MLAIDTSTTSDTLANTGIQRVVRALTSALSVLTQTKPVRLNNAKGIWEILNRKELENLTSNPNRQPAGHRGTKRNQRKWTFSALKIPVATGLQGMDFSGFIEPELFTSKVFSNLEPFLKGCPGPSLALYYDATSLTLPELSPKENTHRFPYYLQELLYFDGIAAISETSKHELLDYWQWLGIKKHPVVKSIPLAVDEILEGYTPKGPFLNPTILCVGSIEGRKNQVSLLHAAEKLWNQGYKFRLTLLGLANQETCGPAMEQLQILQDKKRTLEWLGPRTDEELRLQYATSSFTVYPSIAEGFGLPVLESLKNGKPCVCSSQGAIGEISNGGGCLTVEKPTPEALSKAMKTLLTDSELHSTLCNNARNRTFRTWSDYASDILEFHKSLNKSYEKAC